MPGFFFLWLLQFIRLAMVAPVWNNFVPDFDLAPVFSRYAGCRTYQRYAGQRAYDAGDVRAAIMALLLGLSFEIAIAAAIRRVTRLQGYPIPMNKKKRGCVVTYRHSDDRWFENSIPPRSKVNDL